MSDSEPKGNYEIVPIDKTNIESAASFTGGILGFVLLGPVGGVALAALVNYVSKKDNEAGEALRGLGKTVIESVNYFKKVDSKFKLTEKVTETVTKTVESITPQSETVDNVKSTFSSAINKIKEVDTEYDLVAKGKEVIGIAGSLSDAALEKVDELNQKFQDFSGFELAASTRHHSWLSYSHHRVWWYHKFGSLMSNFALEPFYRPFPVIGGAIVALDPWLAVVCYWSGRYLSASVISLANQLTATVCDRHGERYRVWAAVARVNRAAVVVRMQVIAGLELDASLHYFLV
ncbi:unnamed protein product [Sphagnum jensenii]|uniref:Uncharacterized protein n=1 Tax=Sphagnum jensenii TaxID=128206 RepID=A0ABP0V6A8_9BRYO